MVGLIEKPKLYNPDATWAEYEEAIEVKSIGHIGWLYSYEYFCYQGKVYKSHYTNCIDIATGVRQGARFDSYLDNPSPALFELMGHIVEEGRGKGYFS